MSERKAKQQRRISKENPEVKAPANSFDRMTNLIFAAVLILFLVLGGFAVSGPIKERLAEKAASTETEVEVTTIADYAAENGTDYDTFMADYGLTGNENLTAESSIDLAAYMMTLENYAKFNGVTVDDLRAEYSISEEATNDMVWGDCFNYMPTGVVIQQYGLDFETFSSEIDTLGLTGVITEDTLWGDASALMSAKQAEISAAEAEAEAGATEGDAVNVETETAEGTETTETVETTEAAE